MPFMIGPAPIRRTTKYLESGKIIFREAVKIFTVNYNTVDEHHKGTSDFVFWHLPQIQYKNPKVQCITFRNMAPTPFIRIYFQDAKNVLIDLDSREKEEILDHLVNFTAVCKSQSEVEETENLAEKVHPSLFGFGCKRHCICEVLGQVPCPGLVPLPNSWRQKFTGPHKKLRIPPCYMEVGLDDVEINSD